jgi:Ca2+-transporting ATPase
MFKHIVAQGFYQIFWMFLFLYGLPRHFPQYAVHNDEEWLRVAGILFNTFIFAQIFNLINSRRIADEYNVFEGECGRWRWCKLEASCLCRTAQVEMCSNLKYAHICEMRS